MAKNVTIPVAPDGMAVLLAPDGATGVSFGGVGYDVANGAVIVPVEAVSLLTESFDFVAAE